MKELSCIRDEMERTVDPQAKIEKRKFLRKAVAAAALLVIYACVVFSVPSERLMWQGSYVMGILLLPKPSLSYVRSEPMRENADTSYNLLGFLSVAAILVLAIRKIPDLPPVRRVFRLDHALRVSIEEKIRIMYIL